MNYSALAMCLLDWAVVLGCWQVLVSSDGSKSAKLAEFSVNWINRIAGVVGKYLAHLYSAD